MTIAALDRIKTDNYSAAWKALKKPELSHTLLLPLENIPNLFPAGSQHDT